MTDTEHLYTMAYNRVANKYGKTFTWEIKGQTMGLQSHESAVAIVKALDLPIQPQELTEQLLPIYEEIFPQASLLPGTPCLNNVFKISFFSFLSQQILRAFTKKYIKK